MTRKRSAENSLLRTLPSVDEVLRSEPAREISNKAGPEHAAALARRAIDELRDDLKALSSGKAELDVFSDTLQRLQDLWTHEQASVTQRVINATGVIIHTNLGRAPLSNAARQAVSDAAGYCTLEYDITNGQRGRRGRRSEELLIELTGAEDALIVNNCAAAAFFVLTVFASGGEVVISRGELVEIGGDFRVPDVLSQSGAKLREVGTTNRTKLADYEKAIGRRTRMLLRVHPSNYRIVGFTAMPSLAELSALARKHKVILYEDAGSGALNDLAQFGIEGEPTISHSVAGGADVVTFSGDKLVGGPQAGIIVGRRRIIEKLRAHPLYRTLRASKLVYAALEATLESHRRGQATAEVPVISMLAGGSGEVAARARKILSAVGKKIEPLRLQLVDGASAVGGGAAPGRSVATTLIAITHRRAAATVIQDALRFSDPPVIGRVADERVLLDLRTVLPLEEFELIEVLKELSGRLG